MSTAPAQRQALCAQLAVSAEVLMAVREGHSMTRALADLPNTHRPAAMALVSQALRHWGWALALRSRLISKSPPPWVDAMLLQALALLRCEPAPYPPHTLVNQTVAAVRSRFAHQAGFVNAVLRRALRESNDSAWIESLLQDPQARWNHPTWWIERLQADWPEHWQTLLEAAQVHPPMTLRVNQRWGDAQAYLKELTTQGLQGLLIDTHALVVQPACPVHLLPGFDQGWVSVQDHSAQQASLILRDHLFDGARVLDACAAPGGKTAHLLDLAKIDLLALDQDAHRLKKVSDNLRRCGLEADVKAADASLPGTWWDGKPYDVIVLDAPCSASGIVRRHPDIPWLRRPSDIDQLRDVQARMLDALWPLLAPKGVFLYASCSVFKAEGQAQVDAFLQRTPQAKAIASPGHMLPLADNLSTPHPMGASVPVGDGFYLCRLVHAAG